MGFIGGGGEIADGSISVAKLASNVLSPIIKAISENMLQIKINSIKSGSTLNDWDEALVDIFTDADGVDNSVDIVNTTMIFQINKYLNLYEVANYLTPVSYSPSTYITYQDFTELNEYIDRVNLELGSINYTSFGRVTFYYEDETNSSSEQNYNKGSSPIGWIQKIYNNPNKTKIVTRVLVEQHGNNGNSESMRNCYVYGYENKILQTNALEIKENPLAVQVFATNELIGTASINYDFKIGSNDWQTGKNLNEKILNGDEGSTITLKLNGNGNELISASDYCIFLYY